MIPKRNKNSVSREISGSEVRLLEMPPVSDSLPIKFKDTAYTVSKLGLTCGNCGASIPNEQAFGSVSQMVPAVVDLDLLGICPECQIATPFRIRVRSNRLVEWRDQSGEWQSYTVYAPSRHGVKHALKDLWTVMRERFLPFTG